MFLEPLDTCLCQSCKRLLRQVPTASLEHPLEFVLRPYLGEERSES